MYRPSSKEREQHGCSAGTSECVMTFGSEGQTGFLISLQLMTFTSRQWRSDECFLTGLNLILGLVGFDSSL